MPTIYFRLNFFSTWYIFFIFVLDYTRSSPRPQLLSLSIVIVRLKWLLLLLLQNVWCLTDFMSSRCYAADGWHAHRQKLDISSRCGNVRHILYYNTCTRIMFLGFTYTKINWLTWYRLQCNSHYSHLNYYAHKYISVFMVLR